MLPLGLDTPDRDPLNGLNYRLNLAAITGQAGNDRGRRKVVN
jgi:hypothetical protein